MKLTEAKLKQIILETLNESKTNPLFIFDFDDTLAKTTSKMKISRDGDTIEFTSREFADYRPQPNDIPDYSDFDKAEGETIDETLRSMINSIRMYGDENVFIVTARGLAEPVRQFLYEKGVTPPEVIATAGSTGKKTWLKNMLNKNNYSEVVVYEDSAKNLEMLRDVVQQHNLKAGTNISYIPIIIDSFDIQRYYEK
jgi:hypothetical protein